MELEVTLSPLMRSETMKKLPGIIISILIMALGLIVATSHLNSPEEMALLFVGIGFMSLAIVLSIHHPKA